LLATDAEVMLRLGRVRVVGELAGDSCFADIECKEDLLFPALDA
jgi:hypothetical protein